ncbi:MAG: hypothetical protein ACXWC8_19740 [Limisphaerales bacterium]
MDLEAVGVVVGVAMRATYYYIIVKGGKFFPVSLVAVTLCLWSLTVNGIGHDHPSHRGICFFNTPDERETEVRGDPLRLNLLSVSIAE